MNVNFAESFHSITLKWETDKISFYLDTQTQPYVVWDKNNLSDFNTYYWPFNENFHLIFNVAVGGNNGGQPEINSTTKTLIPSVLIKIVLIIIFQTNIEC